MRAAANTHLIDFAGDLAHELANIFTAAAGNVSLLDETCCKGSGECQQALGDIRRAVVRGFNLTAALKAYAGRQALNPTPCELNGTIADCLDGLRGSLPPGIAVQFLSAPGDCTAMVDGEKLKDVLAALIANAREAMPKGGKLTVTVARIDGEERPLARIVLRDTGTGMAPALAMRACEPLVSTKARSFAAGWGLAVAAGFVRQSGGYLELESTPGRGTAVSIVLPLVD